MIASIRFENRSAFSSRTHAGAMRFADPRHDVGHHRAKSGARRIADNSARARKALPNLLAHGARPGLFGARAKLLCFRLKFLQNPAAILDQPRDVRDVLRMRREPLVERGLCGFGVNDHPADFFHPRAAV